MLSHSVAGGVLLTNITFPDLDLWSCTARANSLTSFRIPWTFRDVPMMISKSGFFPRSNVWIVPMSSPIGWLSSYKTIAGRRVPILKARADRARRSSAITSHVNGFHKSVKKNAHIFVYTLDNQEVILRGKPPGVRSHISCQPHKTHIVHGGYRHVTGHF